MSRAIALPLMLCAASLGACSDETLNPLPVAAIPTVGPTSTVPKPPPPGDKIRDVTVRNPFGSPPQNLMVDGDFEFSIVPEGYAGQYGWLGFTSSFSAAPILGETGGLCRSGIRCGKVKDGMTLFGKGIAPQDKEAVSAQISIRSLETPDPKEPCNLARVDLVDCTTLSSRERLEPGDAPDEDGWCTWRGEDQGSLQGYCMLVDMRADALVDAAILLPLETAKLETRSLPTLSPAEKERREALAVAIRNRRRFEAKPSDPWADREPRSKP